MAVVLNEQRRTVFLDRYAKKNDRNMPVEETPERMWDRVAYAIGDTPNERLDFLNILTDFKFVPGGRIMAGAGVGTEQTFYNCYVIPVEPKPSTLAANPNVGNDSREAIFDTIATMVDIMSRGGGVGINWSTLRPSGSYLSRVSGTSSGPVGWMDVASKAVGEVEQGGSRRGAAMFMINDWHPDVLNFIEAKRDLKKITNANVSVAISDKFMKAVKEDAGWNLEFPNTSEQDYNTKWNGDLDEWKAAGYGVSIYRSMPARKIWNAITSGAHHNGEPGVVFLDRYNQQSTGRGIEKIISVNPCGEQGLGAYSVCNLGSMNLAAYIDQDDAKQNYFDWGQFRLDVGTAVRFLDNVIDKSFYWDERSKKVQQDLRRIGLGVMGLADALILLGLRYGSEEAADFTGEVFKAMKQVAINESIRIAAEKGPAGAYVEDVWRRPYLMDHESRGPLRNLFFLTQAPTGTTSILAGVNSGIEPLFALEYTRKDRTGTHRVVPGVVERWLLKSGWALAFDDDGTVQIPWTLPKDIFVVANDIKVEEHIAMQAAAQKYIDSSVSKTINAPNDHKVADVDKAYMLAYDSGLKGISYFRDGCGRDQVLSTNGPEPTPVADLGPQLEEALERVAQLEEELYAGPKASVFRRPKETYGRTSRLNTSMGTMYLTINEVDGKPVEIFVNVGKAGSDVMSMGEAIGRLVSLGLQSGIPISDVAKQLVGVGGTSSFNPGLVHAIGKALDAYQPVYPSGIDEDVESEDEEVYEKADPLPRTQTIDSNVSVVSVQYSGAACPDCNSFSVVREEGCMKCHVCGWSGC